jgi:hypothetical protein
MNAGFEDFRSPFKSTRQHSDGNNSEGRLGECVCVCECLSVCKAKQFNQRNDTAQMNRDTWSHVFSFFMGSPRDLCGLSRTCRQWNQLVTCSGSLWQQLEFGTGSIPAHQEILFLARAGSHLTKLTLAKGLITNPTRWTPIGAALVKQGQRPMFRSLPHLHIRLNADDPGFVGRQPFAVLLQVLVALRVRRLTAIGLWHEFDWDSVKALCLKLPHLTELGGAVRLSGPCDSHPHAELVTPQFKDIQTWGWQCVVCQHRECLWCNGRYNFESHDNWGWHNRTCPASDITCPSCDKSIGSVVPSV